MCTIRILVLAVCFVAAEALAQGSSRVMVMAGVAEGDLMYAGTEYVRRFSRLAPDVRQREQARLIGRIDRLNAFAKRMKCDDAKVALDRARAQLIAPSPAKRYLDEPADLFTAVTVSFTLCLSGTADLAENDYVLFGMLIASAAIIGRLGSAYGEYVDADVLTNLDRIGVVASRLVDRKEFPSAAVTPVQRLIKVSEQHAGKNDMSAETRRRVATSLDEVIRAFGDSVP